MAVPSNEKDLSGRPGHLDQNQQRALDEFKSKVEQSHDSSQRKWYDDTTLLRFLRARSFSGPKAIEQLSTSSQWRQTQKVDSTYESFPIDEFEESRSFYPRWNGRRDRLGRPIYIYRLASLAAHSKELMQAPEERRYQRIICLTEFLCRFVLPLCADLSSDKSVDCVTTIIDLEGISLSSLWSLKSHLQQSIQLTSANYPETINTICVVNAPSFFPTIWGWVKGMFDEGTRNKVHLIGTGSDPAGELGEIIDLDNLPRVYGGKMDWKYENEPMLDEEIKKRIGADTTKGPVIWENGRMVLLGEGRREEKAPQGDPAPAAESADATGTSANRSSTQSTTTPSSAPPSGTQTPAAPTAPGPPATSA